MGIFVNRKGWSQPAFSLDEGASYIGALLRMPIRPPMELTIRARIEVPACSAFWRSTSCKGSAISIVLRTAILRLWRECHNRATKEVSGRIPVAKCIDKAGIYALSS